jgi:hypothetical protein
MKRLKGRFFWAVAAQACLKAANAYKKAAKPLHLGLSLPLLRISAANPCLSALTQNEVPKRAFF